MWLIVGVSGVTCGGKTTLATNLTKVVPNTVCINQDKYFLPENSERHVFIPELNHNNWEILSSMDMEKMMEDIHQILATVPEMGISVLIIEGHTIFNYPPIVDICSMKFYIDLTRDQCFARRSIRTYDPADVPGYFEKVIWPEHERHMSEMEVSVEGIQMLDGTNDKDVLLATAKSEIMVQIESMKNSQVHDKLARKP